MDRHTVTWNIISKVFVAGHPGHILLLIFFPWQARCPSSQFHGISRWSKWADRFGQHIFQAQICPAETVTYQVVWMNWESYIYFSLSTTTIITIIIWKMILTTYQQVGVLVPVHIQCTSGVLANYYTHTHCRFICIMHVHTCVLAKQNKDFKCLIQESQFLGLSSSIWVVGRCFCLSWVCLLWENHPPISWGRRLI